MKHGIGCVRENAKETPRGEIAAYEQHHQLVAIRSRTRHTAEHVQQRDRGRQHHGAQHQHPGDQMDAHRHCERRAYCTISYG